MKNKYFGYNRIAISRILVIIGLGIICWFVLRGYFFDEFIFPKGKISLDKSSKFGDFIGGVVGAIFTLVGIVLLYETLSLQRQEFINSRKVFEKQQFENTFFGLLRLYNDIVQSIHFENYIGQNISGKDFFSEKKIDILNNFQNTNSNIKNRKIAIDSYSQFYIENKEMIAHYFRTLYRIFKTIHDSDFNRKQQMYYAKILRAQLSESELFFINYNACTPAGQNFRKLIVNFNIIKHLPILERLEFKQFRNKLTDEKINSINQIFFEIIEFLRETELKNSFYKTYLKGKFSIKTKSEKKSLELKIIRNDSVQTNNYLQYGYGLDDFSNNELEQLLKCFFIETFRNGNYEIIAENSSMKIRTDIDQIDTNKSTIWIKATSKSEIKIKMNNNAKSNNS